VQHYILRSVCKVVFINPEFLFVHLYLKNKFKHLWGCNEGCVSGIYNFVLFFGIASVKLEHQRGRSHYSNLPLLVAVCCHGTWKSNFNLWHSYIHSNIKHQKTLWKKKPCIFGFFKILQHFIAASFISALFGQSECSFFLQIYSCLKRITLNTPLRWNPCESKNWQPSVRTVEQRHNTPHYTWQRLQGMKSNRIIMAES